MSFKEMIVCMKAHEEGLHGQSDHDGGQLILTQEESATMTKK